MEFIGWHGTSEIASNKIKSDGFLCKPNELHKIGRRGYGAYFWKELSGDLLMNLKNGLLDGQRFTIEI